MLIFVVCLSACPLHSLFFPLHPALDGQIGAPCVLKVRSSATGHSGPLRRSARPTCSAVFETVDAHSKHRPGAALSKRESPLEFDKQTHGAQSGMCKPMRCHMLEEGVFISV